MKKGPRCPVCGSLQIKKTEESGAKTGTEEQEKPVTKPKWKCYDCYRNFDKPEEEK